MSKLLKQPVEVKTEQGFPCLLQYEKHYVITAIKDYWHEIGEWWVEETERYIYQVVANGICFELHFHPQTDQWLLYRIED